MDKADEECIGDGHVMDNIKSSGIRSDSEVMGSSLALLPMKVNLKPEIRRKRRAL